MSGFKVGDGTIFLTPWQRKEREEIIRRSMSEGYRTRWSDAQRENMIRSVKLGIETRS